MVHAVKGQPHPFEKSRQLQRKLYLAAKKGRERKFHALFDRICRPDILLRAWMEVKRNGGSAGIDGQTIEAVERQGVTAYLGALQEELWKGEYRSRPVRRVFIPKPDGSERPLGIPTVRDRIVQQACRIVIEPLFEANFTECSFGFRPKRSAVGAMEEVRKAMWGSSWVLDADIRKFFDTLDQELLMRLVARRISDGRVLKLLRGWLKAGVMEGEDLVPAEEGTPQGGVISPLLANIYLHVFDMLWKRDHGHLGKLVRYCDDFVVMCESRKEALLALDAVRGIMRRLKLELHPEKTRLVPLSEAGFDFLGFHFRRMKSRRRKMLRPYSWPSSNSMRKIRAKLHEATGRRWLAQSLPDRVRMLNPIIRGWRGYFGRGNATKKLRDLDLYLEERLRRYFKRKMGARGKCVEPRFRSWWKSCGLLRFYVPGICGKSL